MKRECARFQDAIWEAHSADSLPEHVRQHVQQCSDCASLLQQSTQITRLLADAADVPASPDCRAGTLARIEAANTRGGTWNYLRVALPVTAVVIIALLSLAITSNRQTEQETPRVVQTDDVKLPTAPQEIVADAKQTESPQTDAHPPQESIEQKRVQKIASNPPPKRKPAQPTAKEHAPVEQATVAISADQATDADEMAQVEFEPIPLPVAVVVVSWHPGSVSHYSYECVEQSSDQKTVTHSRVTASGDSIDIYMESEPSDT